MRSSAEEKKSQSGSLKHITMAKKKRRSSRVLGEEMEDKEGSTIFWTSCPKCGDTWTTKSVLQPGKCPICGGKPKSQQQVF
jgi:rubrerythrin